MPKVLIKDRVVELWQEGFNARQIAEEIGNSISSVESTIYKLRLRERFPHYKCTHCGNPLPPSDTMQ